MTVQRVSTLPATGTLGVVYIIEPGASYWIWNSSSWEMIESRAQSIAYYDVFKDI